MKIFSWIIKDTSIDFLGYRKLAYALSAVLFAASIASVAVRGFNYGIDFSGGVLIEVKSKNGPVDVDKVRHELDTLNLDELNLQSFGDAQDELMIRAQANNADEESQRVAVKQIKEMLNNDFTFERI